jgi:hypothetical protein
VLVEFHKTGSPKPHADAFQFGVRYSLNGKRKLDPAAMLDEAVPHLVSLTENSEPFSPF